MSDDATLFAAWCDGDLEAGAELFDRHYEAVARFFHNKAADMVAADLVQNTFLACVEARTRFRGESGFRTFAFAVARNVLHNSYRAMRGPAGLVDFGDVSVCDLAPGASTELRAHERRGLLLGALRRLPIECQEVIELLYWEQLSVAQIAEITESPVGTVKTRLRRGRRLLDEAMQSIAASPEQLLDATAELTRWADGVRAELDADGVRAELDADAGPGRDPGSSSG
jgi:RNA polymerase sigma factor (sigma-70 family)